MTSRIKNFLHDTQGAATAFGLFMLMTCFVVGGLALDVASAYMARAQLQATADAVAHTAIYVRDTDTEGAARTAALAVAEEMMPAAKYGTIIEPSSIKFGVWDASTRSFSESSGATSAVFVDVSRSTLRNNPVGTYFLRFVGLQKWDVRRGAVFETYRPTCFREGYVADDIVDTQSNNEYKNGFCIHSNTHVETNQNNDWETGVIVSMPDKRDIVLPASGYVQNPGLEPALRDGAYRLRILNRVQSILDDLNSGGSQYAPSYITNSSVVTLSGKTLDETDLVPGSIYTKSCSGNSGVTLKAGSTISNVVFITDCQIKLGNGVALVNVILATSNTASKSINGSHVRLGDNDGCADGGDTQVITKGGFEVASGLEVYGSQVIALGDIQFAAQADGIEGASFVAGGRIDGTSNAVMGFCGSGMTNNFEAEYFRMAS